MTREKAVKLTRLEFEVMDALWELGSASVREIMERLPATRPVAYTTVQTIVRRLEEKKAVRQSKKVGNAHVFEPVFSRQAAHRRLITDLLNVFGGSVRPLMAHLVEAGKLSLDDIRDLEAMLAESARQKQKKSGARKS